MVLGFLNPRSLTARAFKNPAVLGVVDNYNRADVLAPGSPTRTPASVTPASHRCC
jgi:hypothetical protein